MFTWYRISPSGDVVDTRRAPDRRTAERILQGSGSVVSAASWKLDVFRFRPVRTVLTDTVQQQRKRAKVVRVPPGYIGTKEARELLNLTERQLRDLTRKVKILPARLPYGARIVLAYTPKQIDALRRRL
jgi:hypothetical protein